MEFEARERATPERRKQKVLGRPVGFSVRLLAEP
jgi:hypothetical protein